MNDVYAFGAGNGGAAARGVVPRVNPGQRINPRTGNVTRIPGYNRMSAAERRRANRAQQNRALDFAERRQTEARQARNQRARERRAGQRATPLQRPTPRRARRR